jgi:hypothetical protein
MDQKLDRGGAKSVEWGRREVDIEKTKYVTICICNYMIY